MGCYKPYSSHTHKTALREHTLAAITRFIVERQASNGLQINSVDVCCTGRQASLVTQGGGPPQAEDGSDAVAVVLTDPATGATTRLERNAQGSFYRVFQPNKWRLKKEAEAEAAKQAAAETAAAAAVLVGGSRQ